MATDSHSPGRARTAEGPERPQRRAQPGRVVLISAVAVPGGFVSGFAARIAKELAEPLLAGRPGYRPGTHTGATARPRA